MTASDTALLLAVVATVISLVAAAFSGWQAIIARNTQKSENDRGLVEWESASWPEPEIVELRSKGPDDARTVWARMTIEGVSVEAKAKRIREGQTLRFRFPHLAATWGALELVRARAGQPTLEVSAFEWGAVITWESRYGRPGGERPSGMLRQRVKYDQQPDPFDVPLPGGPV